MCGIAGRLGSVGAVGAPDLTHRGPDKAGRYTSDGAVFDHWRLRVVDLSAAADQPMQSDDGSGVLIYNGEVYNAPELRQALVAAGESFRTSSDTEVVLKLLVRDGAAAVQRLRGMFAFAFWDTKRRRLLLARDSFGIKPLFYSRVGGLQFASELPALLSMMPARPEPDVAALWSFFTFGFVPSPCTAFKGVFKLRPGEVLEFDEHSSEKSRRMLVPPWLDRTEANRAGPLSIRRAVVAAVSEQFQADVPVGVFLSGGMDSNVILAAAREAGIGDIRTFTVDFKDQLEGDSNDETAAARSSAKFFGTHHTEVAVRLGHPDELLEDLDRFGEPFLNPTVYLTRLLSRETKRHVTVALSGAGGDELFGGYPRYAALRFSSLLSGPMGRAATGTARLAIRLLRERSPRAVRRAAWLGEAAREGKDRAFLNWTYYLDETEKRRLFPMLASLGHDSLADLAPAFDSGAKLGGMLLAGPISDLSLFLPENVLAYTDIGSMAESLEVRVPFLDPDVAYLALRALRPRDFGFRKPKRLLRDAFADSLPPHVLRAKKRGFNPPLANWMRGPLDRLFDSEATAEFRRDFVSADELNRMRAAHRSGIEDYSHELLAVLVAARWYKRWR
jgi:asparagine synthase (glutamine-hydrolysing)